MTRPFPAVELRTSFVSPYGMKKPHRSWRQGRGEKCKHPVRFRRSLVKLLVLFFTDSRYPTPNPCRR